MTDLHELLAKIGAAAAPGIPYERIGIALLEGGDTVRSMLLARESGEMLPEPVQSRHEYADRFGPAVGGQPACVRNVLVVPLELHDVHFGVLWFEAGDVGVLDVQQATALAPVTHLLVLAIEQERLWNVEQEKRRTRDRLQTLLPAIADALDIRAVFPHMSALLQDVIPHVTTSLVLLTPDGRGVKGHVSTNFEITELPDYRFTAESETITSSWQSFVAYDCEVVSDGVVRIQTSPPGAELAFVELRPGAPWTQTLARFKIRSSVRVPIRIKGSPIGAISFSSDQPASYGDDDVELATRIADHVALALAHEQLAAEGRRTAKAEERAAWLQERVDGLLDALNQRGGHRALGDSPSWKEALAQATTVADTETTVLITGESGTGKEVVARLIHQASRRTRGPFVALNCAALPEALLESELFGFERGAFTGAHTSRAGRIEQAAGGILFLDEVGEMSLSVQAKFLRVLQEREYQRLGGTRTIRADIRVVAATNRDPKTAIERGTLREDLYYRLGVFEIVLPPLRERGGDILTLADAFLEEVSGTIGRPAAGISEDARELLMNHPWPGNVRELRNAIERAVILCRGGLVTSEHLPIAVATAPKAVKAAIPAPADGEFPAAGVNLEAIERQLVAKALARAHNNKSQAAKLLGLPRGQFYSLLRRHGLTEARR